MYDSYKQTGSKPKVTKKFRIVKELTPEKAQKALLLYSHNIVSKTEIDFYRTYQLPILTYEKVYQGDRFADKNTKYRSDGVLRHLKPVISKSFDGATT